MVEIGIRIVQICSPLLWGDFGIAKVQIRKNIFLT
jgi:hypothetical protein